MTELRYKARGMDARDVLQDVLDHTKPPGRAWTGRGTHADSHCEYLTSQGLLEFAGSTPTGNFWRLSGRGHEYLASRASS